MSAQLPPPPPAQGEQHQQRSMTRGVKNLNRGLKATDLNGTCPNCGGTAFETVRSTGRKVAFGFASLLAPANEVRCVMCGTRFKRG